MDIVSKNGNLLLNFPLPNSGRLDSEEMKTLDGITEWMAVNSEGIYASRPWKIYGEGPSTRVVIKANGQEFDPNEGKKPDLGADDVRYTTKGNAIYAFVQGWPGTQVILPALGTASDQSPPKVQTVLLLGGPAKLKFAQESTGLRVTLPARQPTTSSIGFTLKLITA